MAQLKQLNINGFTISFEDDRLLRISYDDWQLYVDVLNPERPSVTLDNGTVAFDFYRKFLDWDGHRLECREVALK